MLCFLWDQEGPIEQQYVGRILMDQPIYNTLGRSKTWFNQYLLVNEGFATASSMYKSFSSNFDSRASGCIWLFLPAYDHFQIFQIFQNSRILTYQFWPPCLSRHFEALLQQRRSSILPSEGSICSKDKEYNFHTWCALSMEETIPNGVLFQCKRQSQKSEVAENARILWMKFIAVHKQLSMLSLLSVSPF